MTLHSWQALGRVCVMGLAAVAVATETSVIAAQTASVKDTLAFTPKQQDVEYETPKPDEFAKCKVEAERKGKSSGWVVLGPA